MIDLIFDLIHKKLLDELRTLLHDSLMIMLYDCYISSIYINTLE